MLAASGGTIGGTMNPMIEEIEERETIQAAKINQKYGFSVIIGEQHEKNLHRIAEHMAGMGGIRLKTVDYRYFRSEGELINYCLDHKIRLIQLPETRPKITEQEKQERCNKYGLSEKQLQFCEEYLRSHNATRSYMAVWLDETNYRNASVKACHLLKKVGVRRYLDDRARNNRA